MVEPDVTTEGTTPGKLYVAVQNGDLDVVKEIILSATAEDVNWQATNEVSFCTSQFQATSLFYNQQFSFQNKRTALAYAAISGRCDILQEILKHPDADPTLPNKVSRMELMFASKINNPCNFKRPILVLQFGVSPLMSAMTAEVTQMLLAHPKVDANEIGKVKRSRALWNLLCTVLLELIPSIDNVKFM